MSSQNSWITLPHHELVAFLKAISKRDLNLSYTKAKSIRKYDVNTHQIVNLLEQFMQNNAKIHNFQIREKQYKQKINKLERQLEKLSFIRIPMLNKKQQQIACLIQTIELLSKERYNDAYNQAKSKQVQSIIKNVWEYSCLKKYSDKYRGPVKEMIVEPLGKSEQFIHIKSLLTLENQEINLIHQQYQQALRRVSFRDYSNKSQLPLISRKNKSLIAEIEHLKQYELTKTKTFNQFTDGDEQRVKRYDERAERQTKRFQYSAIRLPLEVSSKNIKKIDKLNISKIKLDLYYIQDLLNDIQGHSPILEAQEDTTCSQIIERIINFLTYTKSLKNVSITPLFILGSQQSNQQLNSIQEKINGNCLNLSRAKSTDSMHFFEIKDYLQKIEFIQQHNKQLIGNNQDLKYKNLGLKKILQQKQDIIRCLKKQIEENTNNKIIHNTAQIPQQNMAQIQIDNVRFKERQIMNQAKIDSSQITYKQDSDFLYKKNQKLQLELSNMKTLYIKQTGKQQQIIQKLQKIIYNLRQSLNDQIIKPFLKTNQNIITINDPFQYL